VFARLPRWATNKPEHTVRVKFANECVYKMTPVSDFVEKLDRTYLRQQDWL